MDEDIFITCIRFCKGRDLLRFFLLRYVRFREGDHLMQMTSIKRKAVIQPTATFGANPIWLAGIPNTFRTP
jgi:hypothetical protein